MRRFVRLLAKSKIFRLNFRKYCRLEERQGQTMLSIIQYDFGVQTQTAPEEEGENLLLRD